MARRPEVQLLDDLRGVAVAGRRIGADLAAPMRMVGRIARLRPAADDPTFASTTSGIAGSSGPAHASGARPRIDAVARQPPAAMSDALAISARCSSASPYTAVASSSEPGESIHTSADSRPRRAAGSRPEVDHDRCRLAEPLDHRAQLAVAHRRENDINLTQRLAGGEAQLGAASQRRVHRRDGLAGEALRRDLHDLDLGMTGQEAQHLTPA